MKLYNTPKKQIETIKPLHNDRVTVYTCGPTVYDYPHIGNWFTFIRYDILIRALKASGYKPDWVMNITDVGHLASDADDGEDKLEKGARRENKNAWDIAAFYSDYFIKGLRRLNITPPTTIPKATDHIAEQIELVKQLEAKGLTYVIDDGVYFDTSKFPDYATFARLDLADQQAGARVEYNSKKQHASDFALWKFSPKDHQRDMEWDSPWGKGFPGWHLECSAMAMKYLGQTIDIHAGGIDHIPVHHTNEIAQSEGATGKPFSNYWLHANHITIDGEKIGKSLGNTITLEDIEAKGFSLEAFRVYVLESHYRTQSKFTWEGLQAAHNRLQGYRQFAALQYQIVSHTQAKNQVQPEEFDAAITAINQALTEEDLKTPQALYVLSQIAEQAELRGVDTHARDHLIKLLQATDEALGTTLSNSKDITEQQKDLLQSRALARTQRDWVKSDEIRDQLASEGIGIRDTASGTIWFRR